MARGVSKTKVYEAIKQRWLNLNPGKADRFCEGSPYYLKELNDNLVEPMYDRVQRSYQAGAGRELDKDMQALHSSAAMTYNLFGNRPAYLYDGETYGHIREAADCTQSDCESPSRCLPLPQRRIAAL